MNIAYNADCLAAMKEMPDNAFDLAVVDPPYGIGITNTAADGSQSVHVERERERERERAGRTQCAVGGGAPFGGKGGRGSFIAPKSYHPFDDNTPPNAEYFSELKRVSRNQIIWGGNYFLDFLGSTECMIFWDKCRDGLNFADGEIAWTSFKQPTRRYTFKWNGMLQGDMKNKEDRFHPTQKPVALYRWIFQHYAKPGDKILDTHLGSGSSRIAAYDAGIDFVGYEIDETYFRLQEERFARHTAQVSLFIDEF